MRPRLIGDLLLAAYLFLTAIPLLIIVAGFLLAAGDASSRPSFVQFAPMGCIIFFVPAHLAACTLLSIHLIQQRRLSGLLWAPALLFGAWLTVPFYYWYRVRPGLSRTAPSAAL